MSTPSGSSGIRASLVMAAAVLAAVSGCAGNPPIDAIADADTAVNQAMNAKAPDYAPADLQRALDKVARAKQAMADENYNRARRLAEEAQVDAQAAEAKARAADARRTAQEAQKTMDTLRREMQPSNPTAPGPGSTDGGTDHANP
jgi:hypothetical protein